MRACVCTLSSLICEVVINLGFYQYLHQSMVLVAWRPMPRAGGSKRAHRVTTRRTGGSLSRDLYIDLGSPDGRLTGCLASHTSGGTMCLLRIRMIDERTRWATFSADLRLLTASLGPLSADHKGDRYIDLGPA